MVTIEPKQGQARLLRHFFQDVCYVALFATLTHALAWFISLPIIGFSPAWSLLIVFNLALLCACAWLGHRAGVEPAKSVGSEGIAQLTATIAQVGAQAALVGTLILLGHETDDQLSSVFGQLIRHLVVSEKPAAGTYLLFLTLWCAASVIAALMLRGHHAKKCSRWLAIVVPILLLSGGCPQSSSYL